jgi:hypothetical protein
MPSQEPGGEAAKRPVRRTTGQRGRDGDAWHDLSICVRLRQYFGKRFCNGTHKRSDFWSLSARRGPKPGPATAPMLLALLPAQVALLSMRVSERLETAGYRAH